MVDRDIVCELSKKSFAARNESEHKPLAQQPRPVPKLMLKSKDSFTAMLGPSILSSSRFKNHVS